MNARPVSWSRRWWRAANWSRSVPTWSGAPSVRRKGSLFAVQLAGREPQWMAEGARIAQDLGADIIDINMGCPARQVTGGYSGSALMRDLDHAMTLIEATVAAARVPVTLKMRLGWDETMMNAPELARRAEAAGVQMVTVHGRTRCQFYKGKANWTAIAAVKQSLKAIPLIANGDVDEHRRCQEHPRLLACRWRDGRARQLWQALVAGRPRASA